MCSCAVLPARRSTPRRELDRIQGDHLAYLAGLREGGSLVAAGPFVERSDDDLRGLCVYRAGLDEARELAERDPAVTSGRLVPEVLTWMVPRAEVSFSRQREAKP